MDLKDKIITVFFLCIIGMLLLLSMKMVIIISKLPASSSLAFPNSSSADPVCIDSSPLPKAMSP